MRALAILLGCYLLVPSTNANPKKTEEKPELPVPRQEGSFAVGVVSGGKLYGATKIPTNGKSIAILPDHRDRARGYSTNALAMLLVKTALQFRREQQRRVMLGDLSAKDGGKISGHRSHQNGLDVDIALFYKDKSGEPAEAKEFIALGDTGASKNKKLYLDADATWEFILLLSQSKEAQLQYVFLYEPLCAMILEAGRAKGASDELLEKIDTILRQPSDSSKHDDHMHLRIYCPSSEENLCTQTGPVWSFIQGQ